MPDASWGGDSVWNHANEWNSNEVTVATIGAGGQQNLGVAVVAGKKRVITELTIRHAGTNNTVVTLLVAGGATKLSLDVPYQTTRSWPIPGGRAFLAGEVSAVQTSDVVGGSTYISASGVEA